MGFTARLVSLEDAAALIESTDGIWVGNALSMENEFIRYLAGYGERLKGLTIVGTADSRGDDIFNPKYSSFLRIVSVHKPYADKTVKNSFIKGKYSELLCSLFGINTLALRLSPPDAEGLCGVCSCDAELTHELLSSEKVIKRIALMDMSRPSPTDIVTKVSIGDFDYICGCKSKTVIDSIIA